jgi:hypothetical protein
LGHFVSLETFKYKPKYAFGIHILTGAKNQNIYGSVAGLPAPPTGDMPDTEYRIVFTSWDRPDASGLRQLDFLVNP